MSMLSLTTVAPPSGHGSTEMQDLGSVRVGMGGVGVPTVFIKLSPEDLVSRVWSSDLFSSVGSSLTCSGVVSGWGAGVFSILTRVVETLASSFIAGQD